MLLYLSSPSSYLEVYHGEIVAWKSWRIYAGINPGFVARKLLSPSRYTDGVADLYWHVVHLVGIGGKLKYPIQFVS